MDEGFFSDVFAKAEILYLAINDSPAPYCIPVNYAVVGDAIYIHCALKGKKLDLIRRDGNVSFSLSTDVEIDRKEFTTYYKSLCGTGIAVICEDPGEKRVGLDAISLRYDAGCPRPARDSDINRVAIIRITIHSLSGKRHDKSGAAPA